MLERLVVHNFQKHRKFVLEFDPLVTVITGASDRGKSSLLRALRWCCTNRPSGTNFLRHGEGFVSVRLQVDGHSIKRSRRREGKQLFVLDGKPFAAFGKDVPDEIATLLNIGPENFASQLDPPFWFLKSAGEVSKELNAIIDLSLIDRSMAGAASELRRTRAEAEITEERLTAAKERKRSLSWVPKCAAELEQITERQNSIAENQQKRASLASTLESIRSAKGCLYRSSALILATKNVLQTLEQAQEVRRQANELRKLLDECSELRQRIGDRQREAKEISERMDKLTDGRCPLCRNPVIRSNGNG
jgi:exonuclease SbcC